MLKKISVLGAFLMLFATQAVAQEPPESNLTPRQILLLQVPETRVLRLTITDGRENPPAVLGYVFWSVLQSDSVPGGPFELIRFALESRIESYLTVGMDLREVIWKSYEGEKDYMLAGKFENNRLELIFNASGKELTTEEITAISANIAQWVKMVLQRLNILENAGLAQHIRSQKFGPKKATAM